MKRFKSIALSLLFVGTLTPTLATANNISQAFGGVWMWVVSANTSAVRQRYPQYQYLLPGTNALGLYGSAALYSGQLDAAIQNILNGPTFNNYYVSNGGYSSYTNQSAYCLFYYGRFSC